MMVQPKKSPFIAWLEKQRQGALLAELDEGMADVTGAVAMHGTSGMLTLKIKISREGKLDHNMVVVGDDVALKVPQGEKGNSLFWIDGEYALHRSDPNQMSLTEPAADPTEARPDE